MTGTSSCGPYLYCKLKSLFVLDCSWNLNASVIDRRMKEDSITAEILKIVQMMQWYVHRKITKTNFVEANMAECRGIVPGCACKYRQKSDASIQTTHRPVFGLVPSTMARHVTTCIGSYCT
jgi:hypothetical protein